MPKALAGEVPVHSLDGDGARKAARPDEPAEVHARHATGGDRVEESVPVDDRRFVRGLGDHDADPG